MRAPGWWAVVDGALTSESTAEKLCKKANHLMWTGAQVADFQLDCKFRISDNANSGIQIRAERRPLHDMLGYQADMTSDGKFIGYIYHYQHGLVAERGSQAVLPTAGKSESRPLADATELLKHHKPGEGNHYRVACKGASITLSLNGVKMCDIVDNFQLAAHLARSGRLGKLKTLHAGIWSPHPVKENLPAEPEPDVAIVDWNRWMGPSPARSYNQKYVRGQWRHHEGFSAAWGLHDWASHTVNLCQWAVDADGTTPVERRFENDQLRARYASGVELVMRLAGIKDEGGWLGLGSCPVRFEGENGRWRPGDYSKIVASEGLLAAGGQPAICP